MEIFLPLVGGMILGVFSLAFFFRIGFSSRLIAFLRIVIGYRPGRFQRGAPLIRTPVTGFFFTEVVYSLGGMFSLPLSATGSGNPASPLTFVLYELFPPSTPIATPFSSYAPLSFFSCSSLGNHPLDLPLPSVELITSLSSVKRIWFKGACFWRTDLSLEPSGAVLQVPLSAPLCFVFPPDLERSFAHPPRPMSVLVVKSFTLVSRPHDVRRPWAPHFSISSLALSMTLV